MNCKEKHRHTSLCELETTFNKEKSVICPECERPDNWQVIETEYLTKIEQLRSAISKWTYKSHLSSCRMNDYGDYTPKCSCGAESDNNERQKARKLANLPE